MKITTCMSLRNFEAFGLLSTASYGTAGTSYAQDARRFNRKIRLDEQFSHGDMELRMQFRMLDFPIWKIAGNKS